MTRSPNRLSIITALLILSVFLSTAPAEMYRYTDSSGKTVFTDRPPAGSNAREIMNDGDGVYWSNTRAGDDKDEPKRSSDGPTDEKKKEIDYSSVSVVMYSTSWCGYCKEARKFILSLGAALEEYDIERDRERRDEMKKKSGGSTAVPLIDINGTIIRGYNRPVIKAALDRSATR